MTLEAIITSKQLDGEFRYRRSEQPDIMNNNTRESNFHRLLPDFLCRYVNLLLSIEMFAGNSV